MTRINCSEFTDEELESIFVHSFADISVEFGLSAEEFVALAISTEFAKAHNEAIHKKRSEGAKRSWQDPVKASNRKVGMLLARDRRNRQRISSNP